VKDLINQDAVTSKILLIRGKRVMIDRDLAELYEVETKYLNRQIRRNIDRFPKEFAFQLTQKEKDQLVTNWHRFRKLKHSTVFPYVFTEYGVAMLASVLRSERAVQISIFVVRTFVKFKRILASNTHLVRKLKELETKVGKHDKEIQLIFRAIQKLMEPPEENASEATEPKRRIGYH
jgi:uncharacterized protein YbcC (UPF0753/DUF2309 family)